MRQPSLGARLGAEFLGTFWLVFGVCGTAVLAAVFLTEDRCSWASASSESSWPPDLPC